MSGKTRMHQFLIAIIPLLLALSAQAQKVADGIKDFWVMGRGKYLVFDTDKGLYRLDQGKTKPVAIYEGRHKTTPLDRDDRVAFKPAKGPMLAIDVDSGKSRPLLDEGWGYIEVTHTSPEDAWCVFNAFTTRTQKPQTAALFWIDLKTLRTRKLFSVPFEGRTR